MLQINFISKNFIVECTEINQNINKDGTFKKENIKELMIKGEGQDCNSIIQSEKKKKNNNIEICYYTRWVVTKSKTYRKDALFFNNSTKVEVFQLDIEKIPLYLYELTVENDKVINIFINQFGKQIFSYIYNQNTKEKTICYFKKKITRNENSISKDAIKKISTINQEDIVFDCYELITTAETADFDLDENETFGYFGFAQTENKDSVYHQFYAKKQENLEKVYQSYLFLLDYEQYEGLKLVQPRELIDLNFEYCKHPETYKQESEQPLIDALNKKKEEDSQEKLLKDQTYTANKTQDALELEKQKQIKQKIIFNKFKKNLIKGKKDGKLKELLNKKEDEKDKSSQDEEEDTSLKDETEKDKIDTSSKDEGNKTGNRVLLAIAISALLLGCFIAYKQLSKNKQNQENFDNPSQID